MPVIARYRELDSNDQWQYGTPSCGGDVPLDLPEGAAVPSMAQLQEAFASQPFTIPQLTMQPVGNKTLVNLPTYFEVGWPEKGLGPNEVSAPVQLLSWSVEYRVVGIEYDYDFGDGVSTGWVSSAGGPYPAGDVTHTYKSTSEVEVSLNVRLQGQMRANGGEWQDLPEPAEIPERPVETLTVLEAQPRLVAPGS